ncbi:MAG: DUF1127 domain-containing protein [Parvibaculaceae bacterium]
MTLDTARGIALGSRQRPAPGLFERVRRHFVRAADKEHLRSLDDHLLRDIGINRAQIELREFLN